MLRIRNIRLYPFLIIFILIIIINFAKSPVYSEENKYFLDDVDYAFENIPADLLFRSDVIIRLDKCFFDVDDKNEATLKYRQIITILNDNGIEYTKIAISYDKLRKLKKLEGKLRDADGKLIRELEDDEIKDYSAISGFSLYDDNRVKFAELNHNKYPFTIEYEYEIEYEGLINWPAWRPYYSDAVVERSYFQISYPSDISLRYYNQGQIVKPFIKNDGDKKIYTWEFVNLPEYKTESYGPPLSEQLPAIITAPDFFEIEGYEGDMSDWKSFGQWFAQLLKNRGILPAEAKQIVKNILAGASDEFDKVAKLYEYFQNNTRYVSIQLGIGGWQPFPASDVYRHGYGDCKALVNYMQTLLYTAGINSYPVLTRRKIRFTDIITDFPSNQFNHVILFIPFKNDTIWLECTSQNIPLGHLGADNEDRHALLIEPNGGKLIKIPGSKFCDNMKSRVVNFNLSPEGSASAIVKITYSGNQHDWVRCSIYNKSNKEKEKWLRKQINAGSFRLRELSFHELNVHDPSMSIDYNLILPHFASKSGHRLFVDLNSLTDPFLVLSETEERKQPLCLSYPYLDIDTVRITIPDNFSIEAKPEDTLLETSFSRFSTTIAMVNQNTILYIRRLELLDKTIPSIDYEKFREFSKNINKCDNRKLVLLSH